MNVDIAFAVQRPRQLTEALEDGSDEGRLLALAVGAIRDVDVALKAAFVDVFDTATA
jgi:hypothetical protein